MNQDVSTLHPDLEQAALQFAKYIEAVDTVHIGTHIDPDGDAIGSLLGLAWSLRSLGKRVTAACADPVPGTYAFLPRSKDVTPNPPTEEDLIICLDAGDLERLGKLYNPDRFASQPVVNIDHHITNTRFGDVVLVDPQAAATAEILYLLTERLALPLSPESAMCLLTGIITDTRSFRTSNTTPRVLHVASKLMQAGASLNDIVQQVYESMSLAALCLLGRALNSMQKVNRIIWSEVTQDTLRQCNANSDDGHGIINLLNSTSEADIAILFREDNDGSIDVGFRSKPGVDVAEVALALGGGGHPQASGCRLEGPLPEVRERVLGAVHAMQNGKFEEA